MQANQATPDASLLDFLIAQFIARPGEPVQWTPLAGGVSSDIWKVGLPGRSLCVKRALPQLKVEAEWLAPVSRNAHEWAWMKFAAQHCADSVPTPIAHDPDAGLFAMAFLESEEHPVWKDQLLSGLVYSDTAVAVGTLLGKLHAASARASGLRQVFDTIDNFYALRLQPYLVATAARHPVLAARMIELAVRTAGTHRVLVHGDVSPKNILVGPKGPVFLDAECAWYGDPAFDLAFCLNHLLLKCLVQRQASSELLAAFAALVKAYLAEVDWEPQEVLEQRAAELLPALMLARVDGKSPVEYLTREADKQIVRGAATRLLQEPVVQLQAAAEFWRKALPD